MSRHHQLQDAVRAWLQVKKEKADTMREFNEQLKEIEEQIENLSDRIQEDEHQLGLPFTGPRSAESIGRSLVEDAEFTTALAELAPKDGDEHDSVTISSGGKSVTLTKETGRRLRRLARTVNPSSGGVA